MRNNAADPFSDRKIQLFTLVKKTGDFFFAFSATSRVPTAREGGSSELCGFHGSPPVEKITHEER
jgi:hypothetical protein